MAGRDWVAARSFFEAALSENDQDLLAKVGLAEIAQREGQFEEVLSLIDQVIAQDRYSRSPLSFRPITRAAGSVG